MNVLENTDKLTEESVTAIRNELQRTLHLPNEWTLTADDPAQVPDGSGDWVVAQLVRSDTGENAQILVLPGLTKLQLFREDIGEFGEPTHDVRSIERELSE